MARGEIFDVRVKGLDVIRAKIQSGRLLGPVREELIRRAGEEAKKKAVVASKPHAADKGTLGGAIFLEFADGGLVARVDIHRSVTGIAFTIEEGRRPGRRPPYRRLKAWAIAHGYAPSSGGSQVIQEMRERIRHEGTRGIHFMAQAAEEANRVIAAGIPRTERAIERAWENN